MKNRYSATLISLFALTFSLLLAGRAVAAQELIVSAAASLTNAFQVLGEKFEAANPDVKVRLNFAASGPLLQQIEGGAPVDVFASADELTMNQAKEKNLVVNESIKDFATNDLVLIVPEGAKIPVKNVEDLSGKEVTKIAVGNPETVPVGRYTKEALTNYGVLETLSPKLIQGDSVRQVLDYVSRGEVDAGFVFATDAAIAKGKVKVVSVIEKHKPVVYPIAIVASSEKKQLAQKFLDFVLGKEGREVLSEYGFGKP